MKKILALVIFLFLLTQTTILAATLAEEEQRVFDYAGLMSLQQCEQLQKLVAEYQKQYNIDIVIVTTNDAEGKSSMEYADDFFDYNGFGVGENYDGLLLLIDMDNRMIYISTCGNMISILYDERIEELLDIQYDYVVAGKYYESFDAALKQIDFYFKQDANLPIFQPESPPEGPKTFYIDPFWIVASILTGAGIAATIVFKIQNSYDQEYAVIAIDYHKIAKLKMDLQTDTLIDKKTTSLYIPPVSSHSGNDSLFSSSNSSFSSSSNSHSSSTHPSSSGTTHGGGGRSF